MSDRQWRWFFGVGVAVILVLGVGGQYLHVHSATGRWALTASAPPQPPPLRVSYDGRAYDRGDLVELPRDAVRRGSTTEGAPVSKPAGDEDTLSVIIFVSRADHTWTYGLIGGP